MKAQIKNVIEKAWFGPAVIGAGSLGAGIVCGRIIEKKLAQRELDKAMEKLTNSFGQMSIFDITPEEVDDTVVAFPPKAATPQDVVAESTTDDCPGKALESLVEEMTEDADEADEEVEEVEQTVEVGVFANQVDPDWDYEEELKLRTPSTPYIIHRDEFFGDEYGWDNQQSLTWYDGDKILCDESDAVIYDVSGTVGELKFGHGSGDPNVVYIRNERRHVEYEVNRLPGSYQFDVLGEQVEEQMAADDLKHSHRPGKFRFD